MRSLGSLAFTSITPPNSKNQAWVRSNQRHRLRINVNQTPFNQTLGRGMRSICEDIRFANVFFAELIALEELEDFFRDGRDKVS